MTKAETRELTKIQAFIDAGMADTAARALSALIRSTMVRATAHKLHRFAVEHGLHTSRDYVI
jgi:hypothetical protein